MATQPGRAGSDLDDTDCAAPQSLDFLERVLDLDVDGFDVSDEALAENREFDAAWQTREQRNAEFLLERADALVNVGCATTNFPAAAVMLRCRATDKQKVTELLEVHAPVRGWTTGSAHQMAGGGSATLSRMKTRRNMQ